MARATWKGAVIAESDDTVVVEGNHYFPRAAVRDDALVPSEKHTFCAWKGTASYYSIQVGDLVNHEAAWYYPDPKAEAAMVQNRVAFWHGIEVEAGPAPARQGKVPGGAKCDTRRRGIGERLRSLVGPKLPQL